MTTNDILYALGIDIENDTIEENCGTIWITKPNGKVYAVSSIETEN